MLVQSTGLAFANRDMLSLDVMVSNHGVPRLSNRLRFPAQAVRQQRRGFLQPRVTRLARAEQAAELTRRGPLPIFR
jgi:hypothetical protein